MATFVYREALREALREEMHRDDRVFLIGEEIGQYQGTFGITKGLLEEFGEQRIVDTPIAEAGFTGLAIGAAMMGLRPVVEYMTINFSLPAFDQLVNHAAKYRYMSGGQFPIPMVVRGPGGQGVQLGAQHSQALEAIYAHVPGWWVVAPATPIDAKGMLKTAIRCEDPVLFFEHAAFYGMRENAWEKLGLEHHIPSGEILTPFGVAATRRPGTHVTIITYSHGLITAMSALPRLEALGVDAEVLDLRSLRPLDMETVAKSLRKTHHAVLLDETWKSGGMGAEIAARIMEECFDDLDAPVERVAGKDVPIPFSRPLELLTLPRENELVDGVKRALWRATGPFNFEMQGDGANEPGDNAQNGRGHGGRNAPAVAQEGRGSGR